jgi:hypothetical protein
LSLLVTVLVVALAAYRATRVVTRDSISEAFRDRLYRWAWVESDEAELYVLAWSLAKGEPFPGWVNVPEGGWPPMPRNGGLRTYVSELFQCPWCLGVWVSFALLAVWCWGVHDGIGVLRFLVLGLAVAGVQGFLASKEG